MSYVVDTDVLSTTSPTSPRAIPACRHGWKGIRASPCLGHLAHGDQLRHRVAAPPRARRKAALLQAWLDDVTTFHQSRILMVAADVALRAGQLLAQGARGGVEVSAEDALIAATADVHGMTVLTANARHFVPMGVLTWTRVLLCRLMPTPEQVRGVAQEPVRIAA